MVPDYLGDIYAAFWRLSGSRTVGGMGAVGGIPWTIVEEYALRRGYGDTEDDLERFHALIAAMDNAYRKAVVPKKRETLKL